MADLSRKKSINLVQLRTSTHNLAIETGRYARPAVLSCERKCKMCALDEVEDEVHFLIRCASMRRTGENCLKALKSHNNYWLQTQMHLFG